MKELQELSEGLLVDIIFPIGHVTRFNGCEVNSFPSSLDVETTSDCNGHCEMCPQRIVKKLKDASTEAMILSMDSIAGNFQDVLFLGGEPTIHPKRLITLAKHAKSIGKQTYLTTNGSFLGKNSLTQQIAQYFDGVNISIHSGNLEKNKDIVGVSLNYENLLETVNIISGKKIRINCVLQLGGVESPGTFENMMNFAKSIGVGSIKFAELQLYGSAEDLKTKFVSLDNVLGKDFIDLIMNDKCEANYISKNGLTILLKRSCLATSLFARIQRPDQNLRETRSVYVLHADGKIGGWTNSACHQCHRTPG